MILGIFSPSSLWVSWKGTGSDMEGNFAVILTEHNLETSIPAFVESNGYLR
jgi:hypothetical protein